MPSWKLWAWRLYHKSWVKLSVKACYKCIVLINNNWDSISNWNDTRKQYSIHHKLVMRLWLWIHVSLWFLHTVYKPCWFALFFSFPAFKTLRPVSLGGDYQGLSPARKRKVHQKKELLLHKAQSSILNENTFACFWSSSLYCML